MAISKIKTGSITDSAVNTNKLAPGSVGSTDISTDLVTGLTELSETAADTDYTLIYDTSSGTIKKVLRSNLKQQGPTFTSVSPTNVDTSDGSTSTLTITGTGFTAGSNARLIGNAGKVVEFTTVTRNSSTQITAVVTYSNLDFNQTPYDIQIFNGEGIATLATNQLDVNASPVWITASGSLATVSDGSRSGLSYTLQASDPDSTSAVNFEIVSGSVPSGLSFTSNNNDTATISGTADAVGSDTTSNFTIRAYDSASNYTDRAFSITIQAPTVQIFTSSGTFSVPSGVTAVDVLVVGGGGAGGGIGCIGGGGGAGGLIYRPGFPVTPGGTVSVTVGCGGQDYNPSGPTSNGQDSVFGTLTAKGGGGGGSYGLNGPGYGPGKPGGSGGGGGNLGGPGSYGPGSPGSATQPTQPGDSGTYGFGNAGGAGGPGAGNPTGGGGGGAGASGANGLPGGSGGAGGNGGIGRAYSIADNSTPVYYAGGGGGIGWGGPGGTGGQGGGGNGALTSPRTHATVAGANKGGGGGGDGYSIPGRIAACNGGFGGKGVVIVRWTN